MGYLIVFGCGVLFGVIGLALWALCAAGKVELPAPPKDEEE